MGAIQPVGDTRHFGLGERALEEIEFAAARVGVALGNRQHRAVVLGDDECAVLFLTKIGEIAVVVKDLGDDPHLFSEGLIGSARQRLIETALPPSRKDPLDHCGILILDIGEQFVGKRSVVSREERIAGGSQMVIVARPTGSGPFDLVGDQAIRFERGEMLARATGRDLRLFGKAPGIRHTIPLENLQHEAAGFRQRPDRDFLADALGAFGIERDIGNIRRG